MKSIKKNSKFSSNSLTKVGLIVFVCLITSDKTSSQSVDVTLDHVVGLRPATDTIYCDQPIEFHIRLTNNFMFNVGAPGAGVVFDVYSPDGAIWTPIAFDTAGLMGPGWKSMFDALVYVTDINVSGAGADTVCFWGFSISGDGVPVAFDQVGWIIRSQIDCSQEGKTICLDSVTVGDAFNCTWAWAGVGPPYVDSLGWYHPTWDGPHCFTISPCCTGMRGNVNPNGGDTPNIQDLTWIVGYIFRGSAPAPCPVEADVNADGSSGNVLDLVFLVDFIFRGGPFPPLCP